MHKIARYSYNTLRTVLVTSLLLVILLFALSYLALSIPSVQDRICHQGEQMLSEYLGTPVSIGRVSVKPFDQVTLNDVFVPDQKGDTLLMVDKLGAGISLYDLVANQRLVFTYAELLGLEGHITRPDKQSDTNLQFIIDKLKPKGDELPKPFDVQVQSVVLRNCNITYDVLDQPLKPNRFDPNHIVLHNLRADVSLPHLRNDDFDIQIKRLSLDEHSGFSIKQFAAHAVITQNHLVVKDIQLDLPNSTINLGDVRMEYSALNQLGKELPKMVHEVNIANSTVSPSDFRAFVPQLAAFDEQLQLTAAVRGNAEHLSFPMFKLNNSSNSLVADLSGHVSGMKNMRTLAFDLPHCNIRVQRNILDNIASAIPSMSPQVHGILSRCESLDVDASLSGTAQHIHFQGNVATALGDMTLAGAFQNASGNTYFQGHVATSQFSLGRLIDKQPLLGQVALNSDVDASLQGKQLDGMLKGHVDYIDFKGYRYHDITANITAKGKDIEGDLLVNDPAGHVELDGKAHIDDGQSHYDFVANVSNLKLNRLDLVDKLPIDDLSFVAEVAIQGDRIDNVTGTMDLKGINLIKGEKALNIDYVSVNADNASSPQHIRLDSPIIEGELNGSYDFATLVPSIKTMLSETFPQVFGQYNHKYSSRRPNDLNFSFRVIPNEDLQAFVNTPVKLLYNTTLDGQLCESSRSFELNLNVPYLLQGNKNIIERTRLTAQLDSVTHKMNLQAQTTIPSKKGKINVVLGVDGRNDSIATNLAWRIDRERDFSGSIDMLAKLARNPDQKIRADVDINPTQIVFNDTIWYMQSGKVTIDDGVVDVYNLSGQNENQYVRINGRVSKNPDDMLCLQLNDISLDYVFETLNIDNVDFGGRATGDFYASDLFSKTPRLMTPNLHVDDLSYNNAVMGDADIQSEWLNEEKGVSLKAHLEQDNGCESNIDGGIYIADDSLHLTFDTERVNVAFLQPFMSAFTSEVQGEVSGHAVLLGDFHNINLYGDILVDTLKFKLDYTNVYYTCSGDSVHIVPNLIKFNNVHIHDREGHSAQFDGWLKHDSFHEPVFNFSVTNAHDLLCYDTNPAINHVWYGTVYGNGGAFVTGEPGVVNVKVNMETAPNSKFTFVLSDSQEASEYNFITFHDRTVRPVEDDDVSILQQDTIPELVRQLTAQAQANEASPTHYNIDLQGDITPDAQLIIVMDPVGGDQIKAHGTGNMRMTYNDADELTMFGKYILEKGNYNFTLQDIIIKDFTIKEGSSISFQGDPYAAMLDIEAVYSLVANLRDLDESFANDKEITRTNVPVHALLRAKGIMSEPDISFDLDFPTLTTDAYRKVKSIISTDEMMNQQIVYLLAINRFFTPDYMNTTDRGNELTSVASSTISSQLSNILGKMSENWTISPNFRSDKGDFSDMEVDLALSSQLLNNRLLFNGNFGYRDNTYNTRSSNFIGDFDIEYLLNSRGTLRLKAYNRFNDQSYYVRNALTTQGVGLVWKHDFNNPFEFMRKKHKAISDTLPDAMPADTVSVKSH